MSKKIFFFCLIFVISVFTLIVFSSPVLASDYSHIINLESGWNLVSATRVVESHTFSAPETLDNFDIYLLNPASPSGWVTMADLGQSEFTPLFGYFINNKSTSTQTLTLNYIEGPDPDDRLFSRELQSGWNVVGVANPSYALTQYAPSSTDTNNPSEILVSLSACVDIVVDMTANASSVASVLISDQWEARTFSQVNELNDFRETKAYAVYINETCNYQGWQNNDPMNVESIITVSFVGPDAYDVKSDTDDVVLANFMIKSENLDVQIDTMRVVINEGIGGNSSDNLTNIEMVDSVNGLLYSVGDYTGDDDTYELDFSGIGLAAGVQYNFEIRGDVPSLNTAGQSYYASIDFTSNFIAYFQPVNSIVISDNLTQDSLIGNIITVATPAVVFSKVTTNNATYVENADRVLLYKGKITANSVDDLKVSKVHFGANLGGAINDIGDAFEKLYFYKVNSDSTETQLDSETSLAGTDNVSFTGFTLDIPQGVSNGIYVVVRGDVKANPEGGTMALHWDNGGAITTYFTVKDSNNNSLADEQYIMNYSDGQTSTVAVKGTYNVEFDLEMPGINNSKNVLAGSIPLIGRLKFTANKENAIVEDLIVQNLGDASNDTLARLYLYDNAEMTGTPLGSADMAAGSQSKAIFEDVNIEIPTSGITYIYIATMIKNIDYSNSPGADATAVAETTIILQIPESAISYVTKVVGASTGETLDNPLLPIGNTATSTVYGAVMSNITTDFANGTLTNGTTKEIFSFKVTVPSSSNIDSDGDALGVKLATTTFRLSTTTNIALTDFRIERIGGANSEKDAKDGNGLDTAVVFGSNNTFIVNLLDSYSSTDADLTVRPGDTVEYMIRATITNVGASGEAVQTTIESIDSNVAYVHETGTLGVQGADTAIIRPRLNGVSNVRGGTLSN